MARTKWLRTNSLGKSFGRFSFCTESRNFSEGISRLQRHDKLIRFLCDTGTVRHDGVDYKFEVGFRNVKGWRGDYVSVDIRATSNCSSSDDCCRMYAAYCVKVPTAEHYPSDCADRAYQIQTPSNKNDFAEICNLAERGVVLDPENNFISDDGHLSLLIEVELYERPCSLFRPKSSLTNDLLSSLSGAQSDDDKGSAIHFLVEGKTFTVHRSILRARGATSLIDLVEDTIPSHEQPVPIDGVKRDDFDALLRYLYADEKPENGSMEDAVAMLELSDKYGITDLKLYSEIELVEEWLNDESVAELLLLADAKNCALLKEQAISFFIENYSDVVKSPDWALLKESADLQGELWESLARDSKKKRPAENDDGDKKSNNKYKRQCVSKILKTLQKNSLDLGGSREVLENRLVQHDKKMSELGGEDGDEQIVE